MSDPEASQDSQGSPSEPAGPVWADYEDEQLLDLRLCDLGMRIEGTQLEDRIDEVLREMRARDLRFRPHFWLSSEWFTPDGVPGVAIPFYLAHPRLERLEQQLMLEVEGGQREWCLRILRHEVGHAIDNAYRLHRKSRWRAMFGKYSAPYPDYYQPRPYSKRYVLHLDSWYAQSHPSEDFAETFAVWLNPESDWRKRYQGWPALRKLEYVDELMQQIAGRPAVVTKRARVEPVYQLRGTLREHYAEKRERYGTDYPDFYDRDLRMLFSDRPEDAHCEAAAKLLRRLRGQIRRAVARWTGAYQYTIDQVLSEMIKRCDELKLRAHRSEEITRTEAMLVLTVQTMNFLHGGGHRVAL